MAEKGLTLLQDLIGLAQLPNLPLKIFDPILLGGRQASPLSSITFRLLTPNAQTIRRTTKLRRNRAIGCVIAGVFGTVLTEKPNTTVTQFGRIGGGMFLLRHKAHLRSVLLSGIPGAVQIAVVDGLKGCPDALNAAFPETTVQTCIVHLVRHSLNFCGWKDRKIVVSAALPPPS